MERVKSKFEFEIEEFKKAFRDLKGKRIALYGTGRMTATLLMGLDGYQIIGLLDRDEALIGKQIYGVEIIDQATAEREADIIVINTAQIYWGVIYSRIKTWKLPVYYRNGELAKEEKKEYQNDAYWDTSICELKREIRKHDMISFDIFDTLLVRKTYLPFDVLRLVECKLNAKYGERFVFLEFRKKAVDMLEYPTFDEIYDMLGELSGWDDELLNQVKQLEWSTELQMLVSRKDMVELCNDVLKNKQVYFISDMYFTSRQLQEILSTIGINATQNRILVSCEHRKTKEEGTLWQYYAEKIVQNQSALHIGDNFRCDYEMPRKFNIDAYYIRSSRSLLENSSIGRIVPEIKSLYSSLSIGLILAKLFNSPFVLNKTKGLLAFENEQETGYVLLGSLCFTYMRWLLEQSSEDGIEEIVFLAREGYLLIDIYREFCRSLKWKDAPNAVYLEISRRAIMSASIERREDIYEVAAFPYEGTFGEFLKNRFGLEMEKTVQTKENMSDIQKNSVILHGKLKTYEEKIYQRTQQERMNYLLYIERLNLKNSFGVVDSLLYGNTQYYLGKMLQKRIKGYYFAAFLDENNKCCRFQDMKGCFQDVTDKTGKETSVWKNAGFIEAFFTAPYGMLEYIDENGSSVRAGNMSNQQCFNVRKDMQKGIVEFIQDMSELQQDLSTKKLCSDEKFADKLFGCLMEQGFQPSKIMKESFFYDNGIINHRESAIWE